MIWENKKQFFISEKHLISIETKNKLLPQKNSSKNRNWLTRKEKNNNGNKRNYINGSENIWRKEDYHHAGPTSHYPYQQERDNSQYDVNLTAHQRYRYYRNWRNAGTFNRPKYSTISYR